MIRNPFLYYAGLIALVLGVVSRYAPRVEAALGLTESITDSMPGVRFFVFVAILFIIASMIPLDALFRRRLAHGLSRSHFETETPAQISKRIELLCQDAQPDIPLLVDYTVFQARALGASDIHFDPARTGFTVRYRLDGMMTDVARIPPQLTGHVANRFKVLSNLVVYEGFMPQDGRLESGQDGQRGTLSSEGGDFRIAFMPTLHGERIVIRILGRTGEVQSFAELGMDPDQQHAMNEFIAQPQGMVVLTGPTGSGKTTTIYSALRAIQERTHSVRSIATLEDPIEFELQGINQSQVNEKKNFTFGKGLRALLRQDPDVIMVGEIRDSETADIAIQAGMTGHLIITTVHANSTAATFSRLLEMGLAPYAINTAVTAVIAQRLVRRICTSCRVEKSVAPHVIDKLRIDREKGLSAYEGRGCAGCNGTGYDGRYALYEILEVTEKIRALVGKGASAGEIHTEANKEGMEGLFERGIQAIRDGITTPEEIVRAVATDQR